MEHLSIQLAVYRADSDVPEMMTFTPQEYFDLDEGEAVDVDCVPKHSDPCDYISDTENVKKFALTVKNALNGKMVRLERVYQNDQKTDVTTRCEYQGDALIYKEIIYQSKLPQSLVAQGCAYDLCRFVVNDDETKCIYHGIFHYAADGQEIEYPIVQE